MKKSEEAVKLHAEGCNCAQAVLLSYCDKYGMDRETAMRTASGLGGGMRVGDVCGAVSGAVLVIGLKNGPSQPGDKEAKKLCNEKTAEFIKEFRERFGNYTCRELIKAAGGKICDTVIAGAAELLEEKGY
jgi:C_GCAxxG_C_C family probable redox protein